MSEATDRLAESLAAVLAEPFLTSDIEIRDLVRLSGGASRESWAFDAVHDSEVEELVLRRAPAAISDAVGPTMMLEASAMREAARVGVPSLRCSSPPPSASRSQDRAS